MKYVPQAVTRAVGRTVLKTQKNSPTILFIAGVTGAVTATVLACRATLKAQPVVDHMKKDLINVDVIQSRKQVDQEEARQQRAHIMLNSAVEVTKLYAPSVILGSVSIFCLTKSHRQLTQRNAALTGAYVSLQQFLDGYRARVRKEIGEEREKDVYYASTPIELTETTGKGTKKTTVQRPTETGPYAVLWDERSSTFQHLPEYNIHYIKLQEDFLTDKLRADGYLFLNDVYKAFDIPVTQNGQLVGWIIPSDQSDDFVEIKWTEMYNAQRSIMLDFNCAGLVYHMLDDAKMSR
jgi:hypothetical protein